MAGQAAKGGERRAHGLALSPTWGNPWLAPTGRTGGGGGGWPRGMVSFPALPSCLGLCPSFPLGLTSQAPLLCRPLAVGSGQRHQAGLNVFPPLLLCLSESPARYSNKELKGMLVWSPNHCVSDAKREWGQDPGFMHVPGSWRLEVVPAGGQLFSEMGWRLSEVCGFSPCQGGLRLRGLVPGGVPLSGQAWVRSWNPSFKLWPLPPLQLTSTSPWPRRSTATTLSR